MPSDRVLIVDTPSRGLWPLAARLRVDGLGVVEACTEQDAQAEIGSGVGVLLVHRAVDIDLAVLLESARRHDPELAVMVVADPALDGPLPAQLADAVVVNLPADMPALSRCLARETAGAAARRQLRAFQLSAGPRLGVEALIGESEPMARVRTVLRKLATSPGVPLLVSGEPGTGHGLVARIAHDTSECRAAPLIRVDCTHRETLAVDLFGPGDGSGALGSCGAGTAFLEHVDRLTPPLQAALLQVLEHRRTGRSGGGPDRSLRVRLVTSTTVDLGVEVEEGRFRRDLYHRLGVARVDLAPLRRRGQDVWRLAAHFAAVDGMALHRRAVEIDGAAAPLLAGWSWPGNVRELRYVIGRAVLLSGGDAVTPDALPAPDTHRRPASGPFRLPDGGIRLDALEQQFVVEALERTGGNQTRAAELLGLHRDQIRYRMRKYGLKR